MKKIFFKIFVLFLVFLFSVFVVLKLNKINKYKILQVIEADEFYIDFNKNNKIDKNEYVKLKNVVALKPFETYRSNDISRELGLRNQDLLLSGYLARSWAKDNLLNKYVGVKFYQKCTDDEICRVDLYLNKTNYSKFLLENGLGYVSNRTLFKEYFYYFNPSQIINNANELLNLDFVVLNQKTMTIHKLNCEHVKKLSFGELILKRDLKFNSHFCKKCFNIVENAKFSTSEIPISENKYRKSIHKNFGKIDLYLINPYEYSRPNPTCKTDFCKRLIKEINNAKVTIDIALYGFGEQDEILNALKNAKNRGVKIRVVADKSLNTETSYPNTKIFLEEFSGVVDKNDSLMHNKFFIFDNKIVFTGSVNISSTGSGGYNANIAAFINDSNIAKLYKTEFEQLYSLKFSINKVANNLNQDNSDIKVYFSPQDRIYENVLANLIQNAKKNIYVSAFYLTERNMIFDLIQAKARNVEVLVILDAVGANNFKDRVNLLRRNNIPVIIENWGGKNHEKTILIDNEILVFGSCNFSKNGFLKNDENMVVVKNSAIAKFYSDYFLYLFNSIDKKFLKFFPRAESFDSKNSCYDGLDNNYDGKVDNLDVGCQTVK